MSKGSFEYIICFLSSEDYYSSKDLIPVILSPEESERHGSETES